MASQLLIQNIFSMELCVLFPTSPAPDQRSSSLPLPNPQDLPFPKCSKECQRFQVFQIKFSMPRQKGISETQQIMSYTYILKITLAYYLLSVPTLLLVICVSTLNANIFKLYLESYNFS